MIGHNGSGKSTLLRIMAGLDDGYTGEARLNAGRNSRAAAAGTGARPALDVEGNVMAGVAETAALLTAYEELMARWADPDADFDTLAHSKQSWRPGSRQPRPGIWTAT